MIGLEAFEAWGMLVFLSSLTIFMCFLPIVINVNVCPAPCPLREWVRTWGGNWTHARNEVTTLYRNLSLSDRGGLLAKWSGKSCTVTTTFIPTSSFTSILLLLRLHMLVRFLLSFLSSSSSHSFPPFSSSNTSSPPISLHLPSKTHDCWFTSEDLLRI